MTVNYSSLLQNKSRGLALAMLTAREAQLTFDGREERQRHLSFFRRVHAKRDARVFIDHEVVLCAEKSRGSLSSARAPEERQQPASPRAR